MSRKDGPRVLVFDIETAPILGYVWSIWEQNVGLNQIKSDWYVLSWAAIWLDDPPSKIKYMDQRRATNLENDKVILKAIWKLLDEADIVITQNGRAFDQKKLFARFVIHGFPPPSPFKHIDTKCLAKKHFAFTSNKLEYMAEKLCKKYKKLKHPQFVGFELWRECLAGNQKAWASMEKYNKYDVLTTRELYQILARWDSSVNFSVYYDDPTPICPCGSRDFQRRGWAYTATGKFKLHRCKACGSETRSRKNELDKETRKSLHAGTKR